MILRRYRLLSFKDSVIFLHEPPPYTPAILLQERNHPCCRLNKFDECLAQQLVMRLHYRQRRSTSALVLTAKNNLTKSLLDSLPFDLTNGQKKAFSEISSHLGQPHPMRRLLQGEEVSG